MLNRASWLVVGTGVTCASSVARADLTTWSYQNAALQFGSDDANPARWVNYPQAPTLGAASVPEGLDVFGTGPGNAVFALTGATYESGSVIDPDYFGSQLVISGAGTLNGAAWQDPFNSIVTSIAVAGAVSGGILDISLAAIQFEFFDDSGVMVTGGGSAISPLGVFEAGPIAASATFEDYLRGDEPTTGVRTLRWEITLRFNWSGMAATDSLLLAMPEHAIQIRAVPGAGSISLGGCIAAWAGRRRRRGRRLTPQG